MHRKLLNAPRTISLIVAAFATIIFTLALAQSSFAQSSETGQALEIGPPVINLEGDAGETLTATISLRDISPDALIVTNEVNDFTSQDESGTPSIILDESVENPFSIKSWISPIPQLTLEPKEVREIEVTISIPDNAEPGGYYGVVRFTGMPSELDANGVSLSASLGSLIFINVNGDAKEELSALEFYTNNDKGDKRSFFESAPIYFTQRIKNSGNTYEQPAGSVTIKDVFGNTVATLGVNQPIRTILPSSVRKFEQPLDSTVIGDKFLFGYYTAQLDLSYGDDSAIEAVTISFWVIPWRIILFAVLGLVIAFFIIRTLLRRYNQRVIDRAGYRGSRRR